MEISNTLAGPVAKPNETYVKCFRSNIRRIRITSEYYNLKVLPLFTFLQRNCTESLSELELDTIDLRRIQCCSEQTQTQLKNLTTISFINCVNFDIYNVFLKHCHSLKHLIVKEEMPIHISTEWLQKCYPQLESFVYHHAAIIDISWSKFFEMNSHIKNVACAYNNHIISAIIEEGMSLDYLVLQFWNASVLAAHFQDLYLICEQKRVQRLKFDFESSFKFDLHTQDLLSILSSLVPFDGVSFATNHISDILLLKDPLRFDTLKSLHLELCKGPAVASLHLLSTITPHLEELHLHPFFKEFIENLDLGIGVFACNSERLKILVIHNIDAKLFSNDSIAVMDKLRRELVNSCPLTIYLPYEIVQKIRFNIPVNSTVNVQPISALKRDIFTFKRRTF